METPAGQISYHVPMSYRHYYGDIQPPRTDKEQFVKYDGHTPQDVLERLLELCKGLEPGNKTNSTEPKEGEK